MPTEPSSPSWTDALASDIRRWNPEMEVTVDFLQYDDLFDHAPLNILTYGAALAKLMASGIIHGIGDALRRARAGWKTCRTSCAGPPA